MKENQLAIALDYVKQHCPSATKIALFSDNDCIVVDGLSRVISLPESFNFGKLEQILERAEPGTFSIED